MSNTIYLKPEAAKEWCVDILKKCGQPQEYAKIVADTVVEANLRGVDTHGLSMMFHYVNRFSTIKTRPVAIVRESSSNMLLDGGDNMGMAVGHIAMTHAIEKAKKNGTGVVSVRNSNHFGAAAHFAKMAVEHDMIGIAMTSAGRRLAPWGGIDSILGNNPFSIAVPSRAFPVILDMANSVVAFQKIVQYANEGRDIPAGWAMDSEGKPTTSSKDALTGLLMPVGEYKGSGITILVDILCGALSQNGMSDTVADVDDYAHPRKIGHFFIAIKIADFVDIAIFKQLVDAYTTKIHNVRKAQGVNRILVPGELEHECERKRLQTGIPIPEAVIEKLNTLSERFGSRKLTG